MEWSSVCVMFVTFFDTCMVALVALIVWKLSPFVVFLPWLCFALVDGLYLSSALIKVPDGAWFTLTIAGVLAGVFLLWRFGKENQWRAEAEDRFRPAQLVRIDAAGTLRLTARWGGGALSTVRGLGIYFDKTGVLTPTVLTQFVAKLGAIPEALILFHLHPVETPTVPDTERYAVSRIAAIPGCYRLVVRHGYMDEVVSPDLAALVYNQVRKFIVRPARDDGDEPPSPPPPGGAHDDAGDDSATTTAAEKPSTPVVVAAAIPNTDDAWSGAAPEIRHRAPLPAELGDAAVREELGHLDRAYAAKVMYVIGKEQMKIRAGTSIFRHLLLSTFLWIRENTRAKIANLRLSMDRVVEVGFVKEI